MVSPRSKQLTANIGSDTVTLLEASDVLAHVNDFSDRLVSGDKL
jgi:hypothetical protein